MNEIIYVWEGKRDVDEVVKEKGGMGIDVLYYFGFIFFIILVFEIIKKIV